MSKRDNLRNQFIEIIENQLTEGRDYEETTNEYYELLIEKGMSEERAIELLSFYLEIFIYQNLSEKNYDPNKWKKHLEDITINPHLGEYEYDKRDERRNLRTIQKRYGEIKSDVGQFEDELLTLECHLLVLHETLHLSSLEAKKIIHVVIQRILDQENHETSDFTDYVHEDLLCLADGLEQICNPYANVHLMKYLKQFIEVDDEHYDQIFKNVLLCLVRILKSIDKWDKEFGNNGYFKFIERFIDVDACLEDDPEFFFNDKTLSKS